MQPIPTFGLHHVTAITGDPSPNLWFYREVLGLRLVKKTVNFDMPSSYHLYYGDATGSPGTLLTFFVWQGLSQGRPGRGQTLRTRFSVPGDLSVWRGYLADRGVSSESVIRFGQPELHFSDPDGLLLALASSGTPATTPWDTLPGKPLLDGVVLQIGDVSPTRQLLETMGYREQGIEEGRIRFRSDGPGPGQTIDLEVTPAAPWALAGNGAVHHIAFRARDEAHQLQFHAMATQRGLHPSVVLDRNYFRSIYFRCPAGVLFEVATDAPGFAVDEPLEQLGQTLCLPPALEIHREEIERGLPALDA